MMHSKYDLYRGESIPFMLWCEQKGGGISPAIEDGVIIDGTHVPSIICDLHGMKVLFLPIQIDRQNRKYINPGAGGTNG